MSSATDSTRTLAQTRTDEEQARSWFASGPAIVLYIALAKLILHLLTASRYGYFRDELYFLACSEHLDWGYVDQPPMIALAAWVARTFLGESLVAIRFLPALAGFGLVLLTGAITRELSGRRFAQGIAALSVAVAGVYFVLHRLLTMNAFEPLIWMGCAYVLIRIVKTGNQKLWLWFGVLAGLGLQTKYSMTVFGLAVAIALVLTPERRALGRIWIWLAGAIAFLIFLPNFIWNAQHHWPFLELMRNIHASGRDVPLNPLEYFLRQILLMNPATFPVWLAGLLYLLLAREGKRFRVLAWTYLTTLAAFIVLHGKDYYTTPAYPMLFAAGGLAIENFIQQHKKTWLKPALVSVMLALTALLLPVTLPVLPIETYLRYQEMIHYRPPASERGHQLSALPQYYADSFGWPEMAQAAARVYWSLPPEERAKAGIIGNNFGQSGAIDFFGPKLGLPKSIGVHQNYFLWGPRNYSGEILIVLGDRRAVLADECRQVEVGAVLSHPYAEPSENGEVLVCRGLKWNLKEIWPRLKKWN